MLRYGVVCCDILRCQVYEAYPSLLAEQTAYATAAATLNLKHYRLNNLAIENEKVRSNGGEEADAHGLSSVSIEYPQERDDAVSFPMGVVHV